MEHIVYYFSGTGNSLAVAKNLESIGAQVRSIATEYQRMLSDGKTNILCSAEKVGFVVPTYYLGLPEIVHCFMEALQLKNTKYVYLVATMGWSIKGGVIQQMKKYLTAKNSRLDMGCYIQMPMNDITMVKPDSPQRQEKLLKKAEGKIRKVVSAVSAEKSFCDFEPIAFRADKRNLPFCKTSKTEDKKFTVTQACTGCGICEKICPVNNILLAKKPQWQHKCQLCLSCFHSCPQKAILFDGKGADLPHYHHPDFSLSQKEKYSK